MQPFLILICGDERQRPWFETEVEEFGTKLSVEKACVHFKIVDDVLLDRITNAVGRVPVKTSLAHSMAVIQKSKRKKK